MEAGSFLKSNEVFGLNWFPFQSTPNLLSFLYLLLRMTILSWAILIFGAAPIYYYTDNLEFIEKFGFIVVGVFAVFEEQSRWLYINKSSNITRDSSIFFLFLVLFETFGFFIGSDADIETYVIVRAPSILLHAINCVISVHSFRSQTRIYHFCIAVIIHVAFNMVI